MNKGRRDQPILHMPPESKRSTAFRGFLPAVYLIAAKKRFVIVLVLENCFAPRFGFTADSTYGHSGALGLDPALQSRTTTRTITKMCRRAHAPFPDRLLAIDNVPTGYPAR